MAEDFGPSDRAFARWQELRLSFKSAKSSAEWKAVIGICEEVIKLDSGAKHIGIFVPLFLKELGNAHEKLESLPESLAYYEKAREAFANYRKSQSLRSPDDWLKDIGVLDRKISRLRAKVGGQGQ